MNKIKYLTILEILRREKKISPSIFDDGVEYLNSNINPIDELIKNDIVSNADVITAFNEYMNS